jgi:glycerol uptake facilitator-like aquaporin
MNKLFPLYLAIAFTLSTVVISLYNQPIDAYFVTYVFMFLVLYVVYRPTFKSNYLLHGLIIGAILIIMLITISYIPVHNLL